MNFKGHYTYTATNPMISGYFQIQAAGLTFQKDLCPAAVSAGAGFSLGWNYSVIVKMTETNSASFYVQVSGGSSNSATILAENTSFSPPTCPTFVYGMLLC